MSVYEWSLQSIRKAVLGFGPLNLIRIIFLTFFGLTFIFFSALWLAIIRVLIVYGEIPPVNLNDLINPIFFDFEVVLAVFVAITALELCKIAGIIQTKIVIKLI